MSDDIDVSNSAKRLLAIVERVMASSQATNDVRWAIALSVRPAKGVKPGTEPDLTSQEKISLLEKLGAVHAEVSRLQEQINQYIDSSKASLYGMPIIRLREFLFSATNPGNTSHSLDGSVMFALHHLAIDLPEEPTLDRADISDLRLSIDALFDSVRDSEDLNDDFKKWLLNTLSEIKRKLDLYDIYGGRIFRDIYTEAFGEVADRAGDLKKAQNGTAPELKGYFERLFAILGSVRDWMEKSTPHAVQTLRMFKFGNLLLQTPTNDVSKAIEHITGPLLESLDK